MKQRNVWVNAALAELNKVNTEAAEESLPEILSGTKEESRRILLALAPQPIAPAVYPTLDGEIAMYFKSPVSASCVLLLVGNDGRGACFSYINGQRRRTRYDDTSELPDVFVTAQLEQLANA